MSDFDDREQAAYERTVDLFRTVRPELLMSDGRWTARDVLAHLVNVARRYTSVPRLAETVREVDSINADELAALDGLSVEELRGKYDRGFARYREVWVGMAPEHMWPFHGGGQLGTTSLRTNWLGEMLVHGYDVAAAAGLPWEIGSADAGDLLAFLRDVLPAYGRPGGRVTVALLPDGLDPWAIRLNEEGLGLADPEGAEATIAGPPGLVVVTLYQRLAPADLVTSGLRVDGDPGAVARLFAAIERP